MIFLMGRQKSGISMLSLKKMLQIKGYRTVWIMGHKIRKAMAERDAYYKLAGIIEMDDTYFGAPKSGKRGRGAAGKAKGVVAVETHHDKPGFATMHKVEHLSGDEISQVLTDRLEDNVVSRSDGWRAYGVLDCGNRTHQPVIVGTGENAVKVLPWVHTVIANVEGNIRGVYHGVGPNHLSRYLSEFCYRFNRRFCESQMFDRILTACINTSSISYAEVKA
jgi:transposase-like protein